ncbi:hypothetical protein ACLOAV_002007 [Pseudogymnoascus australis]
MPQLPRYAYNGPVDHTVAPDTTQMKGKSVIVTGGANGIGEACVRAYVKAGAFVTIADMAMEQGKKLEAELNADGDNCVFVKCDIRDWDQQIEMFETAKRRSPANSVDVVVANAGISRSAGDSLWHLDDPKGAPTKPDLNIIRVNTDGTLYTWKLAVHYFRQQPDTEDRDRCFIMTGSMVAWIDSPGNWEYTVTKYGLRGLMRTARRNAWEQGIRINYVAPCWIRSAIRSAEYEKWLEENGINFGETVDCAGCMMRISCDRTITGRSFMITPRSRCAQGFIDSNKEDYGDDEPALKKNQETQARIIEDQWIDGYKRQGRNFTPKGEVKY